jgi:peptidoglycan hydrolase-like protein with peptidoglycan-binding domain
MTTMPDEATMSNAERLQVQDALRRLGYYKGQLDGVFGPLTRAAIRRFQGSIGTEMTGRLTAEEASRLVSTH